MEDQRAGQTAEKQSFPTEQTVDRRERSHSQEHWSASLRNQITPYVANSVPKITSQAVETVSATQQPATKKYEYSFQ